jgi:hypothetical protein
MATPLPTDPDTIAVASVASDVTPFDLAAAIAIVQAVAVASRERAAVIEVVSQQEQAAMAAAVATTAPADLATALATLQARVATTEVEA